MGKARPVAICADALPDGYEAVPGSSTQCPVGDAPCSTGATCDAGTAAYAVGFLGGRAKAATLNIARNSTGSGWYGASREYPNMVSFGTGFALCAAGTTVDDALFADGFD
jgi:hypothetical protein